MTSPRITKQNVVVEGISRNFVLLVPSQSHSSTPLPVVFMLHGDGGLADHAVLNYGWKEKAVEENFIAIFPEGQLLDPSKPYNFVANPTSWSHDIELNQKSEELEKNVAFFVQILSGIQNTYPVDPTRIYFTGFSKGAMMSFYTAAVLRDKIAAIAPVCGYMPKEVYNLVQKPISIMFIVGNADTLNPIDGGAGKRAPWFSEVVYKKPMIDSIDPWLHVMGLTKDSKTVIKDDHVKILHYGPSQGTQEIYYIIVKGQGHEWPGGKQVMPVELSGKNLQTFKATDAIWDFFKTKRLDK